MRLRSRHLTCTLLLSTLLAAGCGLSTPGAIAQQRLATSTASAQALSAAQAELTQDGGTEMGQAESGLDADEFAIADENHDGKLSLSERLHFFSKIWEEVVAYADGLSSVPAPDTPLTGTTSSYSVPHATSLQPVSAEVFIDQGEILDQVYQTLASAQTSIDMDVYLLGGNEGQKIAQLLIQKQQLGVQVHLLHDPSFGTTGETQSEVLESLRTLEHAGVAIRPYPLSYMPHRRGNPFANSCQIDHDKYLVVDGTTAMIGSMNLIDVGTMNHDVYTRITGPMAQELQAIHDATWALRGPSAPNFDLLGPKPISAPPAPHLLDLPETGPAAAMGRLTKTDIDVRDTKQVLLSNIQNATKSVHVCMYDFGDMDVARALVAAYKRGVDVKAIVDDHSQFGKYMPIFNHIKVYGIPNLRPVDYMQANGVPVRWYVPQAPDQELHMKVALFDGNRVQLGSTNYTYQAFGNFRETGIDLQGGTVAPRLETMFANDWATHVRAVPKPGLKERCFELAAKYMDTFNLSWW